MRKINKIIHTAGVLNRCEQIANLKGFLRLRPYANSYAHNMTIQYGGLGTELPWYIGKPESDELWDVSLNLKQVPHITLGTAKDVEQVYSNSLLMSKATHINVHMKLDIRCGAYCIMEDAEEKRER